MKCNLVRCVLHILFRSGRIDANPSSAAHLRETRISVRVETTFKAHTSWISYLHTPLSTSRSICALTDRWTIFQWIPFISVIDTAEATSIRTAELESTISKAPTNHQSPPRRSTSLNATDAVRCRAARDHSSTAPDDPRIVGCGVRVRTERRIFN